MRGGSDHEGDGGWSGKDHFTSDDEDRVFKHGIGLSVIPSEGQEVFNNARDTDNK